MVIGIIDVEQYVSVTYATLESAVLNIVRRKFIELFKDVMGKHQLIGDFFCENSRFCGKPILDGFVNSGKVRIGFVSIGQACKDIGTQAHDSSGKTIDVFVGGVIGILFLSAEAG